MVDSEDEDKDENKSHASGSGKSQAKERKSKAQTDVALENLPSKVQSNIHKMVKLTDYQKNHPDLVKVRQLRAKLRSTNGTPKPKSLHELNIMNAKEVHEMTAPEVSHEIERVIVNIALSIVRGEGLHFTVPSRTSSNQIYIPELDRIVLSDKVTQRAFTSTASVRKTAITSRVMQLVHQLLQKSIHVTKRDLFYTDVKLFTDQGESDTVLDDVACIVGCTRSSLNVVASEKGIVIGRVIFRGTNASMSRCTFEI